MEHDAARVREFGDELAEPEWAELVQHGRPRQLSSGALLLVEGTRSDTVVIVISGRVKVFTTAEDGTEAVVAVRGPGAVLGELAAIDGQPHSASAACLEPLEVLAVGRRQFIAFLHAHPQAMWVLMRILARRLREANRDRLELGVYDTLGRLARRLVELADRYGQPTEAGIRITLPLTQDELARWIGASPEAVTKAFRTLRAEGCVRTQRRTITVIDVEGLRRRAR